MSHQPTNCNLTRQKPQEEELQQNHQAKQTKRINPMTSKSRTVTHHKASLLLSLCLAAAGLSPAAAQTTGATSTTSANTSSTSSVSSTPSQTTTSGKTSTLQGGVTPAARPVGFPTIIVKRTPNPLTAGQSYTVTWSTTNADTVTYTCTASGTGFQGSAQVSTVNGNSSGIASAAWVGYPSSCQWQAGGAEGTALATDNFSTNPAPLPAPTCSSVAPQASTTTATTGTFRVYAYGVSNASVVQFPTWGDTGGQDDLVWYQGTNAGNGTWYADVNLANHKAGNPEYGNFNTHVYMSNANNGNTLCNGMVWTRTQAPVNNAQYASQSAPASLSTSQSAAVSVTMTNTGTTTWPAGSSYKLGTQSPQDNTLWGVGNRVIVNSAVAPGQNYSFNFTITAPSAAGSYHFQWRMLQEGVEWFGGLSPDTVITVAAPKTPPALSLSGCSSNNPTTAPSAASTTCTLSNTGQTAASSISYSAVSGTQIVGPTSCNANSTCGSLTFTSSTNAGNYTGTVSITPSPAGTGTSLGINLTVNANPETVTYIHTDGLGSPVAKTNASGIRITQTKYEAYGMTVAGSDTPTIGFTGHVNDVDTGLTYMQQRYYDPVAGRFLSEDPITTDENTGRGFNRYAYAQNNPYRYFDPDGRTDIEIQPVVILPAPLPIILPAPSVTITGHRDPFVNDPFSSPVVGSPSSGPKMPSTSSLVRTGCVLMPLACAIHASSQALLQKNKKGNGKKGNGNVGLGTTKPNDAPTGTVGLDTYGDKNNWDKDKGHAVKDGATGGMGSGDTWIGVAPDGTVGTNLGGKWNPQGHHSTLGN